jgi:hypothetical protein
MLSRRLLTPFRFCKPLRDRVAYWTVAGLWDKTTERGSPSNGYLGDSEQYADDFKADNNFYPSQWEALGSASAVVLQMWIERALSLSAPMPAIKDEVREASFPLL